MLNDRKFDGGTWQECDFLILMERIHVSFKIDVGCEITGYGHYVENCDSSQAGSGEESFSLWRDGEIVLTQWRVQD